MSHFSYVTAPKVSKYRDMRDLTAKPRDDYGLILSCLKSSMSLNALVSDLTFPRGEFRALISDLFSSRGLLNIACIDV